MSDRLARLVVRGRIVVVVVWVLAAVGVTLTLPSIREAQVGSLGDLVPVDAAAIDAEERSARLFSFPVLSRTVLVARDPSGLSLAQEALLLERLYSLNRGRLPTLRSTRGYLVPGSLQASSLARGRVTSVLEPLLFPVDIGPRGRNVAADEYADRHVRPLLPDGYVGVTGAIPARAEQSELIEDHLPVVELATLAFVLIAVGGYFRALLPPLLNLVAVAISYAVSVRLVAVAGRELGVSVPSEVQPVMVALLFGIITDYSFFYLSRYRRRLGEGGDVQLAARRAAAELTPIVLTCGLAIAAACTALLVADLGFLQAFGPGMALSVLIAVAVATTFIPASMALTGRVLFWPTDPLSDSARQGARERVSHRIVSLSVRHRVRALIGCLSVLLVMGAGTLWLDLDNPLIRGLPDDSSSRTAYIQAQRAFVPGALSPTVVVVEASGIASQRDRLARLQRLLAREPGVSTVIGPATNPTAQHFGAVLARNGNAARYVLVLRAEPLGHGAMERLRRLRDRIGPLLDRAGLAGATASFAGDTALAQETVDDTVDNVIRIIPAVLLAVLLVIAVFLRSLVAPLYLLAAAALAPLAALGAGVAFFQGILDQEGIVYYVPVAAGVLLVALGSDYNIYLAGRIWREARRQRLEEAIVTAGAGAARAISAAGIVLAASFAAMALVPVRSFQQLGFIMATGLLVDAFLVRAVLVPAMISLVGYPSAWPGKSLRSRGRDASERRAAPGPSQ